MKKLLMLMMLAVSVFSVSARDTYTRDVKVLPTAAQTVLKNNFKSSVSHIKIDKDLMTTEYDVVLNNGTEITFDKDGNWKDVEMNNKTAVPSDFVPVNVANYVKQNQKNAKIVGIEKDRGGYSVDLSNGVEIKFDKNGNFVRYDN